MATKNSEKGKKRDGIIGLRLDIPNETATKLTQIADADERSRKKYCEKLLKDHAKNTKIDE